MTIFSAYSKSDCALQFRVVNEAEEKWRVCDAIANCYPVLQEHALFRSSIPHFVTDSDYHFFVADLSEAAPGQSTPYAFGLVKNYRDSFNELDLLGVEALCFGDGNSDLHFEIIERLRRWAQEQKVWAVCISPNSLNHRTSFRALLRRFGLNGLQSVPMQGARRGIYSAFTDKPDWPLFLAQCIRILAQSEQWNFEGQIASITTPLYRGEGRLKFKSKRQNWEASDFEDLSEYFFTHGFRSRIEGNFTGAIHAQLMHQGYVEQPTVSLSQSDEVCAYYATDKYTRKEGGIVFRIDSSAFLRHGRIYDSLETLRNTCPWVMGGFYELITKIMSALDDEQVDTRESGAFLARCHEESRRRVQSFGGGETFGPRMNWPQFLGDDVYRVLAQHGISEKELNAINNEFELFWNIALGQMISMDEINIDGSAVETISLSRSYFKAFEDVRLKLQEQLVLNQFSPYNHLGWDLSPFGYITKTIRDREFFSDGDIPGDCILEARLVDMMGQTKKVIANARAAGA